MSFPRSSPSMTLQSSDSNAKNFIVALQSLIADKLSGNVEENTKSSPQQLVNFIDGLSADILSKFSYGYGVEWQSIKDIVKVVELSLEVIQRVVPRARRVFFEQAGSVKNLFTRLVVVCNSLDLFAMEEVEEVEGKSNVEAQGWIEPKVLRDKAIQTVVDILRCLGNELPAGLRTDDSQRKVLRTLLEEMITTSEELVRSTVLIDPPFTIHLFSEPRFQKTNVEDENRTTSKISMVNATELPRITSLFIEIIMKTLYPPLLSDWFLCELNRRATESLYATFEHCMTSYPPTIPIIPKVLARIVSTIPLPSESPVKGFSIPQTVQRLPMRSLNPRFGY
ncbi:hypothetical protein L218DRAFT_101184 [Marasmius fiardii PR-910]|nr:hypothetical protein L218DRAFT_101184 [Marasmius fiardii PR-910]